MRDKGENGEMNGKKGQEESVVATDFCSTLDIRAVCFDDRKTVGNFVQRNGCWYATVGSPADILSYWEVQFHTICMPASGERVMKLPTVVMGADESSTACGECEVTVPRHKTRDKSTHLLRARATM